MVSWMSHTAPVDLTQILVILNVVGYLDESESNSIANTNEDKDVIEGIIQYELHIVDYANNITVFNCCEEDCIPLTWAEVWSKINGKPGLMDTSVGAFNPPVGFEVFKINIKRGNGKCIYLRFFLCLCGEACS